MPAAVPTAFHIACWLMDAALQNNEYLSPQKLQRLLFLAQSYYGAVNNGRKLMPATFIADEMGPVEPNVYLAFSKGRLDFDIDPSDTEAVASFLDDLWRRFGHHSADHLTRTTKQTPAYRDAFHRGERSEIGFEAMCRSFADADFPCKSQLCGRQRIMITQTGRPVAVHPWTPGMRT
jgi:uncharacterized phage-associated protein